jgi:hypothetical protein
MGSENLELWDKYGVTDPDHTKEVKYGPRQFTAIDAYYKIRLATEEWGPVGTGWGWEVGYEERGQFIDCHLSLWYGDDKKWIRTVGSAKIDDIDGPKKALTDAITKGLSYLGFCNDVFLGRFDDNKYVEEVRAKKEEEKEHPASRRAKEIIKEMEGVKTLKEMGEIWMFHKEHIKAMPEWMQENLASEKDKLKKRKANG